MALRVLVARADGQPVATADWFDEQLRWLNRVYGPLGVGFRVGELVFTDTVPPRVATRRHRSRLSRQISGRRLHVFVTGRLDDLDVPDQEIRGVHWRTRRRGRRVHYVIVSAIAPGLVLAHEIGHYFGLPHSTYPESIMNKTPRDEPRVMLRSFAKPEYKRLDRGIRHALRRELRTEPRTHAEGR